MAEKATVGYLPGSDPESIKANMEYSAALQRMQQALEARQNRMFDPQMLAIAEGFLGPTQTGSFFEALGRAAKGARESQSQMEKEEREIAQAQLGLAGTGLELQRRKARDVDYLAAYPELAGGRTTLGMQPSGALPAGAQPGAAQPAGAPSGALPTGTQQTGGIRGALSSLNMPEAPPGFSLDEGVQTMPVNTDMLSRIQNLKGAAYREDKPRYELEKELARINEQRFKVTENATHDLLMGRTYYTSTETKPKQVLAPVYNDAGEIVDRQPMTLMVTARQSAKLDLLAGEGSPKYFDEVEKIRSGPPLPKTKPKEGEVPKEGEPPKEGIRQPSGKLKSVEQLKAEEAGATRSAERRAEAQEKERDEAMKAGAAARSALTTYETIDKIASTPQSKLFTGIFEKKGLWPAIAKFVETGIGMPGFTVGLPAIRDVMTQVGLNDTEIAQYQLLASQMANVQLQISRLAQGQGQVSDFERGLFGQAGLTTKDTPTTIRAKIALLRTEAEFSQKVASGLRKFKGNIEDFKETPEYQRLVDEYKQNATNAYVKFFGASPKIGQSSGRDNRGSAARLESQLNQPR